MCFSFSLSLTMMSLGITQCTHWTPLNLNSGFSYCRLRRFWHKLHETCLDEVLFDVMSLLLFLCGCSNQPLCYPVLYQQRRFRDINIHNYRKNCSPFTLANTKKVS